MRVYHGSYSELKMPDLMDSGPTPDLGKGFYVTADINEARRWAVKRSDGGKKPIVSIYEFDESKCKEFSTAKFDGFTEEWFDFIVGCKYGNDATDYEIAYGAVTDSAVLGTIEMYKEKLFNKKEAIRRLGFDKPNIMIAFRSMNALRSCLRFVDSETL